MIQRFVSGCLQRTAAQFEDDHVSGRFSRPQWVLLLALVAAAALLRFWGVGTWSLHAPDEGTTALPALHILQDGRPLFPSGMLYTRAYAHLYSIAGSVALFGNNEWALRLPSVLCGVLLVWLAVPLGRRFLTPRWNLAFAAIVAFLPTLITDSQVVRMYVFLIASLAVYSLAVFRWEASAQTRDLVLAVVAMLAALHFHQLAIFGSLVLFMPALVRGDTRLFWQACAGFALIFADFFYIRWTPSEYPLPITDFVVAAAELPPPAALVPRLQSWWSLVPLLAGLAAAAWVILRGTREPARRWLAALVALTGLCVAAMFYHVGVLLAVTALVLSARHGWLRWRWAAAGFALMILAAAWQLHGLMAITGSLRKAVGGLVGQPSIWQYIAASSFSSGASLLVLLGIVWALLRLARHRRLPDIWLYFILAVAAPLFLMGLTDWYFPPRYVEFALLPLLLTALAVAQNLWRRLTDNRSVPTSAATALAAMAIVNPVALVHAVNAGAGFSDHKGAALYVKSHLNAAAGAPRDIVVAEDVLYPWYYLGHVDYWLMGRAAARSFAERVDGVVVYQYTHTPLIGTADELRALIARRDRGTIWIVGSGEDMDDGRRFIRGPGISALLASGVLPEAYVARDGRTRVWRIPPPAPDPG